ncbi:magnesium/cobalt transporter CorA [Ilyomonas limi]|nr:magnesium/cobalt transporter CorA [Ilyomonas limi]
MQLTDNAKEVMSNMYNQTTGYLSRMIKFDNNRERRVRMYNPICSTVRQDAEKVKICVYDYNKDYVKQHELKDVREAFTFKENGNISWINIDGIRKADIEAIGEHFGIHPLIQEDILSIGQRPKMDEGDDIMYCLLNMLYFNEDTITVEQEQISIVLGKNFVITFQEDADRDVFNGIREKLNIPKSKLRSASADYLAYSMIDTIVDFYFVVMDKLSDKLEAVEEEIIRAASTRSLAQINSLRRELIVLRRNVLPVRDMVSGIIRSDSPLLDERVMRYFKDVSDHITQAADMVENYRDMIMSMQDLYLNKANIRLNEVMKVMAIVTCLMAPATVIGGIFGMNFDRIPYIHNRYGFFIAVALMLLVPVYMIYLFKKRGWFKRM